jgi:hypothetical protein
MESGARRSVCKKYVIVGSGLSCLPSRSVGDLVGRSGTVGVGGVATTICVMGHRTGHELLEWRSATGCVDKIQ